MTGKSKYVINLSHAMFELCINIDSVHFGNVLRYTFIVSFSKLNGQFSIMESTHSIISNEIEYKIDLPKLLVLKEHTSKNK